MAETDYISVRRLGKFWQNAKEYIDGEVSAAVNPDDKAKEIINVLTASVDSPVSAQDGDLYIDTELQILYELHDNLWQEVEASTAEVYITADTGHVYIYHNGQFEDVTGQMVDNRDLYVSNLTIDLAEVTDAGMYNVYLTQPFNSESFILVVSIKKGRRKIGLPQTTTYFQTLRNNYGYRIRTKVNDGNWSEWEEYQYVVERITDDDISHLFH